MDVTYCPTCGSMSRPGTPCRKGCGVALVSGPMDEAIRLQGEWVKAQPAPVPAPPSPYNRAARATKPTARQSLLPWQRPCTCGHCMTCIGEG